MSVITRLATIALIAVLAGCGGGTNPAATAAATSTTSGASQIASISRPPTISGSPATTATVGQAYQFVPSAADPNGLTLSFTISGQPSWTTFDPKTGTLSGTPAASNVGTSSSITITASDGSMSTALAAFSITVAAAPAPVAASSPPVGSGSGTATLHWTAPTLDTDGTPIQGLAGYVIYYGLSSTALDQTVQVSDPTATSYSLTNLSSGTWYFAVESVNSAGTQSAMSTMVSKTVS